MRTGPPASLATITSPTALHAGRERNVDGTGGERRNGTGRRVTTAEAHRRNGRVRRHASRREHIRCLLTKDHVKDNVLCQYGDALDWLSVSYHRICAPSIQRQLYRLIRAASRES